MSQRDPVDLVPLAEAAQLLDCSDDEIQALIVEEGLTVYRVGADLHLDRAIVERLSVR